MYKYKKNDIILLLYNKTLNSNNIPTYQHTNIIINNCLLYCVLVCLIYLCILANKLNKLISFWKTENTNLEIFNSKSKQIYTELNRIKSKSIDLADNNIMLRRSSEDLKNELMILKLKQMENTKNINLLRSQSFDSMDNKYNLENEIQMLKQKQYLYQKDTILFKHLINDIQQLKHKYNELKSN